MGKSQDLILKLKKKYPMLHYFTDRPFGIEIEFYGLDYYILPPDNGIIKPYNVHSVATDGRNFHQLQREYGVEIGSDRDSWHFEEDSSIVHKGGVELVSPILHGFEGLIEAYRFFQLLNEMDGIRIGESCGFHVHHGVDSTNYQCAQLKELVRIIHPMEDYIYLLISGERRTKETCRPMELDTAALFKESDCEVTCRNNGCRVKQLWYSAENRYDAHSKRHERYDLTRYHGLNLHSYWYRSTIEFRYHSAVLQQRNEALQWIVFTQFLVELSTGYVPILKHDPDANKWMKVLYKIYLARGYLNRIKGWRDGKPFAEKEVDKPRTAK